MEYINIGTDSLNEEYSYPIIDTASRIKPAGGLWCTNHLSPYFNEWLDYMIIHPRIFVYKSQYADDPFRQKGIIVRVNDQAKIFQLNNSEAMDEFKGKYNLSYEQLSRDYDGIYLDLYRILGTQAKEKDEFYNLFSVSTMLLFNINAIKEYQRAAIDIEPFDYEFNYEEVPYTITAEDERLKVQKASPTYEEFVRKAYEQLKDFVFHLRRNNPDKSTDELSVFVEQELLRRIGEEIAEYARLKQLDQNRLSYGLALKTLVKVK